MMATRMVQIRRALVLAAWAYIGLMVAGMLCLVIFTKPEPPRAELHIISALQAMNTMHSTDGPCFPIGLFDNVTLRFESGSFACMTWRTSYRWEVASPWKRPNASGTAPKP